MGCPMRVLAGRFPPGRPTVERLDGNPPNRPPLKGRTDLDAASSAAFSLSRHQDEKTKYVDVCAGSGLPSFAEGWMKTKQQPAMNRSLERKHRNPIPENIDSDARWS
jgi:hypothetical protein